MKFINMDEAKTDLAKYIEMVNKNRDEVIVICKDGVPVGQLVAFVERKVKKIGILKGRIKVSDDFDDDLPHDMIKDYV